MFSLFSEIGGVFGAVQEKRAAEEASRLLQLARQQAFNKSAEIGWQFDPFVENAKKGFADTTDMLKKFMANVEGLKADEGLTAADRIAYQDAAKLLNEQMVSTGNLRSGAAAFGQSELLRRVVADAETRRFGQEMAKFGLLSNSIGQSGQLASIQGQIGLSGKQISASLFQSGLNLSGNIANAELQKGAASSNLLVSSGVVGDTVAKMIASAVMGGMDMGMLSGMGGVSSGMLSGVLGGMTGGSPAPR